MSAAPRVFVCALCFATLASAGTILNTLDAACEDQTGWSHALSVGFSASGGNTDELSLAVDGRVIWRGEKDVWRLQGGASRKESGGVTSSEDVVGHLRHNHKLGDRFHTVAFTQLQQNPFQLLSSRWLLGGGLRLDLFDADASLGVTTMLEVERLTGGEESELQHRLSLFLRLSHQLSEGSRLSLSGFYQPLWSSLSDTRATGTASLKVSLTEFLSLEMAANLDHDAMPPVGVAKTDWATRVGISFSR